MNAEKKSALKFPCDFPIKVMGKASDQFEAEVISIIHKHVDDLNETAITSRLSKDHNYLAITVNITAESQDQLDQIYEALSANPYVIMAL